jgi:hypothetical protein
MSSGSDRYVFWSIAFAITGAIFPSAQMLRVAEVRERRTRAARITCSRGTACIRGDRQQVVLRRRARSGSGVAIGTLPLELQMQLMGKLLTRKRTDKQRQQ